MNLHFRIKFNAALLALAILTSGVAFAQSFSLGTDIVSRYVWRGSDFGESASFQPTLSFSAGGFEIGSWASYSISADGASANEHDLWIGYTVDVGTRGSFSFGVTDYYFPAPGGADFFDFDGDGAGSHFIEPFLSYSGPESFPISLYGGVFVHNDPDNSLYLEASYPFKVDGVELGFTAGAVANESALYGTDGFALVNVGFSATKKVNLSDEFTLPVSVAYLLNPDQERSFLVIGFGISL